MLAIYEHICRTLGRHTTTGTLLLKVDKSSGQAQAVRVYENQKHTLTLFSLAERPPARPVGGSRPVAAAPVVAEAARVSNSYHKRTSEDGSTPCSAVHAKNADFDDACLRNSHLLLLKHMQRKQQQPEPQTETSPRY